MNTIKALVLALTAVTAVKGFGQVEYAYDDPRASERTLVVTVTPKGAEETLDVEKLAPEGAVVTNLTKRGEGTLLIPGELDTTPYAFDLVVEAGVYKFAGKTGVGDTSRGTIVVCDGATLWNTSGASDCDIGSKITYISGAGVDGMGACYIEAFQYNVPFGKIVLAGDSKIALRSTLYNQLGDVELCGHRLEVEGSALMAASYRTFTAPGEMLISGIGTGAYLPMDGWKNFQGGSSGTLAVSNVEMRISNCYPYSSDGYSWKLDLLEEASISVASGLYPQTSTFNRWDGPISLESDRVRVFVQEAATGEVSLNLPGKVSGGGFRLEGRADAPLTLFLSSSENDFTNGIAGAHANLHLSHDGALPTTGNGLVLTNANVRLDDATAYHLPSLMFGGSSTLTGAATDGSAESVTKCGEGVLTYDAMVSAAELNIEGGTVDLSCERLYRKALAGLVYGEKVLTDPPDAGGVLWGVLNTYFWQPETTGELGTNAVVNGMNRLYTGSEDGFGPTKDNMLYTYAGYLWNNSPTNELWTFAGTSANAFRLMIDGKNVLGRSGWYGSDNLKVGWADGSGNDDIGTNSVWLAPGPHRLVYLVAIQVGTDITSSLQYFSGEYINTYGLFTSGGTGADFESWADNVPILYNNKGVCTRNHADYQKLIDPGDGSLFTYDIPSADVVLHPITGETVKSRPEFDSMRFAPGAAIRLGGHPLSIPTLTGWPTTEDGDVAVTGTWMIDPAEVGVTSFAVDGKLTLGNAHRIVFLNDAKPAKGYRNVDVVLGEASGGIEGVPMIDGDGHWKVFVAGNQLKARYQGNGSVIILR